jgi:hypothetical protein
MMEKNYSKSEILKFLYGELDPEQEKDFIEALYSDEELFKEFEELQEAQADLNLVAIEFSPSETSLKAVMEHVKTAPPVPKRKPIGVFTGAGIPGMKFFASVSLVLLTCITIGFFVVAYQKSSGPQPSDPEMVLHWEAPAIHNRLNYVRNNLSNMSGRRDLPIQVHSDTYRLVNTANYRQTNVPVRLVNVK